MAGQQFKECFLIHWVMEFLKCL